VKLAIMQPYFFPYIGYWQLINAVDKFVVYDQIEYTKKGWINRNQILLNGSSKIITLPIKKDSDWLNINERRVADVWDKQRTKLLNLIKAAYGKAPEYKRVIPLIEECLNTDQANLFEFLYRTINLIARFLYIDTEIIISSNVDVSSELKSQDRVIETCRRLEASQYINPQGGVELYKSDAFQKHSIDLKFLFTNSITYNQYENEFIPYLSIIDVLMFNSTDMVSNLLNQYKLQPG